MLLGVLYFLSQRATSRMASSGSKTVQKPVINLAEHNVASESNGIQSDSTGSISSSSEANIRPKVERDASSHIRNDTHKESAEEHSISNPPTSSCSYYHPGFSRSFTPLDDYGYFQTDGSQTAMQSDNGSMVYYFPGYDPYASGTVVGVDGQNPGQHQYYTSSGYLHHPVSYGSEAVPCYSWDSTFVGDVSNGSSSLGNGQNGSASANLNSSHSYKSTGNYTNKSSKSTYSQPFNSMRKLSRNGSESVASLSKGYRPVLKFSSFGSQKEAPYTNDSSMNYKSNGSLWNGIEKNKRDKFNRNSDFDATELICGPRAISKSDSLDSSVMAENLGVPLCKDQFNLPDFETEYTSAKFYVIKSYSEDDIHKSIKYGVWSSTPNGNKKLDAAFRCAEERANETGTKCPIFLFFSVNRSGQFVGLAEMAGLVDFNKDMDFWQVDKWSGFFPVKWHVIKDIPHSCLRHIILENNDGRPVTFTRDTHEIGLKHGLEMLNIFKSFSAKTSLLDDFSFYENREKSLQKTRGNKPATLQMDMHNNGASHIQVEAEGKFAKNTRTKQSTDPSSLIKLTENLSLNGYNKSDSIRKPGGNPNPVVPGL